MGYREFSPGPQGTSFASRRVDLSVSMASTYPGVARRALVRVAAQLALVASLIVLAALNISTRGWTEQDDGVLWEASGHDVIARVVAEGSPAARAGIRAGDTVIAVGGRVVTSPRDVVDVLHGARESDVVEYTITRPSEQGNVDMLGVTVAGLPNASHWLYLALAGVGLFSLLVGTGVRLRRPPHPPLW